MSSDGVDLPVRGTGVRERGEGGEKDGTTISSVVKRSKPPLVLSKLEFSFKA